MKPMNVLVTGATAGMGEAIARRLVEEGHVVVATGRRADRLAQLAASAGPRLHARVMDVTKGDEVRDTVAWIQAQVGPIDALINNAGLALGLATADKALLDDWQTMVDVNVMGLIQCTHAVLPAMVARNRGWIINIGSVAGSYAYPGGNVYGATKAFTHQFSMNLRADLIGKGVRVTSLEPGLTQTEFSSTRFKGDEARADRVYEGTQPMRAEDIAATVSWLLAMPEHVNVNVLELMPICQAPGPLAIQRTEAVILSR